MPAGFQKSNAKAASFRLQLFIICATMRQSGFNRKSVGQFETILSINKTKEAGPQGPDGYKFKFPLKIK